MLTTRVASLNDLPYVRDFYSRFDYAWRLQAEDVILIAEQEGEICAALRLVEEQGVLLLRGMRVADDLRRQGIGAQLLQYAAQMISERECYCIPLRHLIGFYAQIGIV